MPKPQLRADQGWIFDNFLMLSENEDVLHPGIMGTRLGRGFMMQDLTAVYTKVTGRRSFPKAWAKRAAKLETMAKEAEGKGRLVTARRLYHRAALCFGRAQHLVPVHRNPNKEDWYRALYRNYDKLIELSDGAMEKVSLEFEPGHKVHAVFHKAPGDGPKPTVLIIPGMDALKEDVGNPFENDYTIRGMNICCIDGPGQGECNFNETWLTADNYQKAASAVIDWLVARDDVDGDKVGAMGMSMGSRWGVQVGAADKRVKAVVGQMANVGTFDIIFEQAQPNFKRIFMYMTGYTDEDAFDEHMKTHDHLPDVAKELTVPHLLVAGDMDELCTPQDIETFRANLAGPTELWLYEGIFHPMGEVSAEIYPAMADWMLTTLNEGRPAGYNHMAYVEEGTTLAEHEHG